MTASAEIARQEVTASPSVQVIDPEKQFEYVNGHVEVKEMGGARHGRIGVKLISRMDVYIEKQNLGAVYGPDTTFTIGGRERMPDISFVSAARIPPEGDPVGIWTIAPDLAVEIVSPNDLHEEVEAKIHAYFAAGVRQVWKVSPQFQTITIYDSPTKTMILQSGDELTSPDVLPGFRCPVEAIFQPAVHG